MKKDSISAALVLCAAFGFLAFGLVSLWSPEMVFGWLNIDLPADPTLLLELRAFYGGLEIGLAVALLWTLGDPSRISLGLGLVALSYGAIGLTRALAMIAGGISPTTLMALALEIAFAVAAVLLLRGKRSAMAWQPDAT